MIVFMKSFKTWLASIHPELVVPIMFGHVELMTDDLYREYRNWCKTEEVRRYLKGGDLYEEEV